MSESSFEIEVGILLVSNIREVLESEQFHGSKIRFREGKGWFSRTFSVKGETNDVYAIRSRLEYYTAQFNK